MLRNFKQVDDYVWQFAGAKNGPGICHAAGNPRKVREFYFCHQ